MAVMVIVICCIPLIVVGLIRYFRAPWVRQPLFWGWTYVTLLVYFAVGYWLLGFSTRPPFLGLGSTGNPHFFQTTSSAEPIAFDVKRPIEEFLEKRFASSLEESSASEPFSFSGEPVSVSSVNVALQSIVEPSDLSKGKGAYRLTMTITVLGELTRSHDSFFAQGEMSGSVFADRIWIDGDKVQLGWSGPISIAFTVPADLATTSAGASLPAAKLFPPGKFHEGANARYGLMEVTSDENAQVGLGQLLDQYRRLTIGIPDVTTSRSFLRMLYLSAVTITTLGYGDIVPVTFEARTLVAFEAVLGIVTIGFFINSHTSGLRNARNQAAAA